MKNILVALLTCSLVVTFSCKKACYKCRQYCAYCVSRTDSAISYKTCATKSTVYSRIDSVLRTFPDSTFKCNLLKDETNVCDSKSGIDDALSFYQKEDYYCNPIQ